MDGKFRSLSAADEGIWQSGRLHCLRSVRDDVSAASADC